MSGEASNLNCQITPSQGPLTVGDKLLMTCTGDLTGAELALARTVNEKGEPEYGLHILGVKSASDQAAEFVVTSYVAGEHKDMAVSIRAGDKTFRTSPLTWQVQSVLDPAKQPEMAPSMGPFVIAYPIWFWVAIVGAILFSALMGFLIWRSGERKRALYKDIERHLSMLPPYSQFSKDLRQIMKRLEEKEPNAPALVDEIERSFRLYLLREFKTPALDFTDQEILKDIKKRDGKVYELHQPGIRRMFFELNKAKKDIGQVKREDLEQMTFLCRQLTDKINADRPATRGAQ